MCFDAGSSFASGGRATSEKWRRFIVILLYYPSINLSVLKLVLVLTREGPCLGHCLCESLIVRFHSGFLCVGWATITSLSGSVK